MRVSWLCLLAAAFLTSRPVLAQDEVSVPAHATIGRMCSSGGAYQYAFGETGVPGGSKLMRTISDGFPLPESAKPFDHAKPWSTEWSDRLLAMDYVAPPLDEEALVRFAADLDTVLTEAGWQRKSDDFDPPIYMMIDAGDWTWTRPDPTAPQPAELVLGLHQAAGELTLTCGQSDLMLAQAREALGELPPGTPRPRVPNIPVPPLRTETDCAEPDVVAEIAQLLSSQEASGFMAQMAARTTYRDRLTSWMMWKLEQSGKIPPERLIDLSMAAVGSVSPEGNPFAQFEMLGEMIEVLGPVAKAEAAKDAQALCRSLVPLQAWLARVDALTLKQTEATQAALTAEAARLAVSFD